MGTASESVSINTCYASLQSLKDEEIVLLLKKFGSKTLSSSAEDKCVFARVAIACGAMGLASEVLQGLDDIPVDIATFLNGEEEVSFCDPSLLNVQSFEADIESKTPRMVAGGQCSQCSNSTLVNIFKPRFDDRFFLCPHCLAILKLEKHSIRSFLEHFFIEHMHFLEKKFRKKQLSIQDCSFLLALAEAVFPWLKVRFGVLRSERIGHFAMNTEKYFSERDAGVIDNETLDFLGHKDPVSNNFLKHMWNRVIRYSSIASVLAPLLSKDSPHNTYRDLYGNNGRDVHLLWEDRAPMLSFTEREMEMGQAELRRIGIEPGAEYVCLNVRDNAYLQSNFKGKDWSYHDFRDSDVNDYKEAALALADKGLYVLRMGAVTANEFHVDHPRIIDYSKLYRTEFLDVFLCGTCKFMISTGTGIDGIAFVFRRPVIYVNLAQASDVPEWSRTALVIYKHFIWKETDEEMSLREIFESGASSLGRKEDFDALGVYLRDNSPEELKDVCLEMNSCINNGFEESRLTEQQLMAKEIIRPQSEMRCRIGTSYLEKNRFLLRD